MEYKIIRYTVFLLKTKTLAGDVIAVRPGYASPEVYCSNGQEYKSACLDPEDALSEAISKMGAS